MKNFKYNLFRAVDAGEYVDAYRTGISVGIKELRSKMINLNTRMQKLEKDGREIDSYLLAAYRGYEHAP